MFVPIFQLIDLLINDAVMLQLTDALAGLVHEWRTTLPPPSPMGSREDRERLSVAPAHGVAHCAALSMHFMSSRANLQSAATRLGEVLRIAALAASRHVDPAVWNALWHDDAMCPKSPAEDCLRCDALDLTTPAVIDLHVQGEGTKWTGEAITYGALFDWDERLASDAFRAIAHTLRSPHGLSNPRVRLHIRVVETASDLSSVSRDLKRLLDRARETGEESVGEIVGASVRLPSYEAVGSAGREILATLLNSGLPIALAHHSMWNYQPMMWTSLLTAKSPHLSLVVLPNFQDYDGWIVKLLRLLMNTQPSLRELHLIWHLTSARASNDYRMHAAEAIGSALLSKESSIELQNLTLNIGELTEEDVRGLEHGAGDGLDASFFDARFRSVHWCTEETPDNLVVRVTRLFGAVGVRHLHIDASKRPISCRTLCDILLHHPQAAQVAVRGLNGNDVVGLDVLPGTHDAAQLKDLELCVSVDTERNSLLQAMEIILNRVGTRLTRLAVAAAASEEAESSMDSSAMIDVEMAPIIVHSCPNLEKLEVTNASPQFYERLLTGYNHGGSRLKSLTVQGEEADSLAVVARSLGDPKRCRIQGLTTIRTSMCIQADVLKALAGIPQIQRLELLGRPTKRVVAKLQALSKSYSLRLPSDRRQMAFMSVMTRLPRLDRDLLRTIFEFAGRRVGRYAVVSC